MRAPSSGSALPTRVVATADEAVRAVGGRLARTDPRVRDALLAARAGYARAFVRGIAAANVLRYRAPPDPYRLCYVDPHEIRRVAEFSVSNFRLSGVVRGGSWDLTDDLFADLDLVRAYRRHFRDGVPWARTDFFSRIVDELEAGGAHWGCESRADFAERCRRLDDLYASIRDEGYRSQAELRREGVADPIGRLRSDGGVLPDEVAVHVGRDGDLLFEDGRNRLSIAKLLDVEEIPVRVLLRHRRWQETRDAYVSGAIPTGDDLASHPDLRPLTPRRS